MRKIIILLVALLISIATMSYFYFLKLNTENNNNELALQIATNKAGITFTFQNDKSFYQIIESQQLLQQFLGEDKTQQLYNFKQTIIDDEYFNSFIDNRQIYLSLLTDKNKSLNFLFTVQIPSDKKISQLKNKLIADKNNVKITGDIYNIKFNDSLSAYFSFNNDVVVASTSLDALKSTTILKKENLFATYIKANNQNKKNVLATMYVNFNEAPQILKKILSGSINGELNLFNHQNSFATLNYNFSKEKILFNGNTELKASDNYLNLFDNLTVQNISITNLLPENLASYTVYAIDNYKTWQKKLNSWFSLKSENERIQKTIKNIKNQYRIDLNTIFPIYSKNQFITFQLNTAEKLGAITLSDGEKVKQLLIDISDNYTEEIKIFKSPDVLYSYYGEPFKKFQRPYYTIIDNNLIFANNASTVQSFLNSYKSNKLLIQSSEYLDAMNQVSNNSNVSFYINLKNADGLFRNNLIPVLYKHIKSDKGLKTFDTFYYQMSADKGKFITNLLLNKYLKPEIPDTLINRL